VGLNIFDIVVVCVAGLLTALDSGKGMVRQLVMLAGVIAGDIVALNSMSLPPCCGFSGNKDFLPRLRIRRKTGTGEGLCASSLC